MVKVSLSGNTIYLRFLSIKGYDAIRPNLNCFISMIISVDTLCGFAPLLCSLVTFSSAHNVDTHLYCKTCDDLSGFDNK